MVELLYLIAAGLIAGGVIFMFGPALQPLVFGLPCIFLGVIMFGFAVVASTKTKREKAKNKDVVIIEKGKIVKYGNIDVKLLDDVPIEILRKKKNEKG